MTSKPPLPLPTALPMPLRDLLRGVASFAEATEEILEPAASALPSPVRDAFRSALEAIEGTGAALINPRVDHEAIFRASAFFRGEAHGAREAEYCAAVLAFAWAHMRGDGPEFHHMLSETLTSVRLAQLSYADGQSPSAHAASVVIALRESHVAGTLPGLPVEMTEAESEAIDQKLFAFSIWLLAARGASLDEEAQLLDMAMALTRAFKATVLPVMGDAEALAAQLHSLSEHL